MVPDAVTVAGTAETRPAPTVQAFMMPPVEALLVLRQNCAVVDAPNPLMLPLMVALVDAIAEAAEVIAVGAPTETRKVCSTGTAAAYVVAPFTPPACVARMVQLPWVSSTMLSPLTVQTLLVSEVNETVSPEEEVAPEATGEFAVVFVPGFAKVMT